MSEKRMVYAEDVIQRLRDLAPEILGGWYNPDMENELEQLVCIIESTPTAADTGKMKIFPSGKTGCSTTINTRRMGRHERKTSKIQPRNLKTI